MRNTPLRHSLCKSTWPIWGPGASCFQGKNGDWAADFCTSHTNSSVLWYFSGHANHPLLLEKKMHFLTVIKKMKITWNLTILKRIQRSLGPSFQILHLTVHWPHAPCTFLGPQVPSGQNGQRSQVWRQTSPTVSSTYVAPYNGGTTMGQCLWSYPWLGA